MWKEENKTQNFAKKKNFFSSIMGLFINDGFVFRKS